MILKEINLLDIEVKMALSIDDIKKSENVAKLLEEKRLATIGQDVVHGYEIDEKSREEWRATIDKAMDIAKQITEQKSFPWPGAANIKMPIITKACIEYAARTMPEIIPGDRIVKGVVVGQDIDGLKIQRSHRVTKFMSYQLLSKSPDWEDGMDSLIQTLPVLGTVFKKTYYSPMEKRVVSEMCVPDKIVVNYNTQSLDTARRVTHILQLYRNDIIERQRRGFYLESVSVDSLLPSELQDLLDTDYPLSILEQHCYLDLDDDGYKEPYVVTVHKETSKVLRIVSRFSEIEKNKDGEIVKIDPIQYFTDYHFIKSPDGGFYSMGFGSLLLPLNTTINTLVNQLLDAGTLSNTQGGFLGRGLRIKNGEFKIKMGEWKVLDAASGTSIGDNVFPLPVREPSATLFQLLGLMLQEAKELSSTTDVLTGRQPAQNVASNTINQLIEQGTKIFAAINKRVYRSLKKEYQKIYDLNYNYISQKYYQMVLDDPNADIKKDFEKSSCDVYPIADPTLSTDQQRLIKAQIVASLPTVDRRAADSLVLDCLQLDEHVKQALQPPVDPNAPPPPDMQKLLAEVQEIQASISKMAQEAAIAQAQFGLAQQKLELEKVDVDTRMNESAARVWKMQQDALHNMQKDNIISTKAQHEAQLKDVNMAHKIAQDLQANRIEEIQLKMEAIQEQFDNMLRAKELEIQKSQMDTDNSQNSTDETDQD